MPYKVLFLLGHMRSGSSLLTHILVTNYEIIGFGETHIKYYSEDDFDQLLLKVNKQIQNSSVSFKYVLDKILHNNKLINETLLCSEQVEVIFLLREPRQSLASIAKLKPHLTPEEVLEYYSKRLEKLANHAKLINTKKRSFWLTHNQLIYNTKLVFKSLQNFLGVQQPFSEEYEILPTTGKRFIGDQSERIKSGRIIRDYQILETSVSPEIIDKGMQAFNQCINTLQDYSNSLTD